jgi:excisionase family DNA binding protein
MSLSEAAKVLAVHASTLRLWADQGEIASQRTAGGHRRFKRADVETFAAVRRDSGPATGAQSGQLIAQNALGRTRMQMAEGRLKDEKWYGRLDEKRRQQFRDAGRRLLMALVRYLSDESPAALAEAGELGKAYNTLGVEARLPLSERVRVFLFFNEFLYQSVLDLYRSSGQRAAAQWATMHARVQRFSQATLMALVEAAER